MSNASNHGNGPGDVGPGASPLVYTHPSPDGRPARAVVEVPPTPEATAERDRLLKMQRARKRDGNIPFAQFRSEFEMFSELYPIPKDARIDRGQLGGVTVEQVRAGNVPEVPLGQGPAMLLLHGGGFVSGSLNTHRELCCQLSASSGARVVAVEYRRAPEAPYPAALEDCYAVYRAIVDAAGGRTEGISLAGDSAGGGLCLSTQLRARRDGVPLAAALMLMSPWVDLTHGSASVRERERRDPVLQPRLLERTGGAYLNGADARDPLLSPLFGQFAGMPPMLIQVGTEEILYDDSVRLAERAGAAGVSVRLEAWDSLTHGWQMFGAMLSEGVRAVQHVGRWARQHGAV